MTFISPKGLQLNDRDCSRLTSFWGPGGEGGGVGGERNVYALESTQQSRILR